MKRYIPLILDTIAVLALAVWLGGLAMCWLALASTVHGVPAEAVPAAHTVFAQSLSRFSGIVESCGVVLAALQWALRRRYQRNQRLYVADGVRMLVMFVALFAAEYGRYVLIPALVLGRWSAVYGTLEALAIVQLIALAGYAAITCLLHDPGPGPNPRPPAEPPMPCEARSPQAPGDQRARPVARRNRVK